MPKFKDPGNIAEAPALLHFEFLDLYYLSVLHLVEVNGPLVLDDADRVVASVSVEIVDLEDLTVAEKIIAEGMLCVMLDIELISLVPAIELSTDVIIVGMIEYRQEPARSGSDCRAVRVTNETTIINLCEKLRLFRKISLAFYSIVW